MNISELEIFNSLGGIIIASLVMILALFVVLMWIALPIFLYNSLHRMEKSVRELVNMMININVHVANTEANARRLANFFEGRNVELNRPQVRQD